MAQLKGPLFSLEASKQLGKSLIYKTKGSRSFVTKYNKPGGVKPFDISAGQLDKRMIYNLIVARWQVFSDAEKLAYTNEAKNKQLQMSGWNLFYQYAINDLPTYLGLQGYWSFNQIVSDKFPDLSGNGNNGTPKPSYPSNAPDLVDSISPKFGQAADFDGTDDYVDCGNHETINPNIFTIEFMFYPRSKPAWERVMAKNKYDDTLYVLEEGWMILWDDSNNLFFSVMTPAGEKTSGWVAPLTPILNAWNHIVFSVDATIRIKAYLNGELVDDKNWNETYIPTNNNFFIGAGDSSGLYSWSNSKMDEIRFYNRVVGPWEISKHYQIIK